MSQVDHLVDEITNVVEYVQALEEDNFRLRASLNEVLCEYHLGHPCLGALIHGVLAKPAPKLRSAHEIP